MHGACSSGSASEGEKGLRGLVTEGDLQNLCKLVEEKDGGPAWIQMMDRSTPTMSYQAWRRDPEVVLSVNFIPLLQLNQQFSSGDDNLVLKVFVFLVLFLKLKIDHINLGTRIG